MSPCALTCDYLCAPVSSFVHLRAPVRSPVFTCVHLCDHLCSRVFSCVQLCSPAFACAFTCVHLCGPLRSPAFTCAVLCPPVFTCVHLCAPVRSPVFFCVQLCAPVCTCVHLCVHLCPPVFSKCAHSCCVLGTLWSAHRGGALKSGSTMVGTEGRGPQEGGHSHVKRENKASILLGGTSSLSSGRTPRRHKHARAAPA